MKIENPQRKFIVQIASPEDGSRSDEMVVTQGEFELAVRGLFNEAAKEIINASGLSWYNFIEVLKSGELFSNVNGNYNELKKLQNLLDSCVLILAAVNDDSQAEFVKIPLFNIRAMLPILMLSDDEYLEDYLKRTADISQDDIKE